MPGLSYVSVLRQPAVRNGTKFALAGTLALGLAWLLRLQEPEWAVTTAFVCSVPKFVGAVGEKTLLRIIGAVAGALIGTLLVASLASVPVLFVLAMGLLVSITTTLYGGALAPYGFRQCGYTATLVAASGLSHPALAWQVGLARCEEICLGIAVTMVVTTFLWPRYARIEFLGGVRETLGVLGRIFRQQIQATETTRDGGGVLEKVGGSFSKLRTMIRLGSMESRVFHRRKPQVDEIVALLGALTASLSNFGRTLPTESVYQQFIEAQVTPLQEAIALAMERMADPLATAEDRRQSLAAASACLGHYQARLHEFRQTKTGDHASVDESLDHAGFALSLHEICDALERINALLPLVEQSHSPKLPALHLQRFRLPDRAMIKAGLRGGLSVLLGLSLLAWLHPRGGGLLLAGLYLFTVFSMDSSHRKGDLGAFRPLAMVALACGLYFLLLLLLAPLLSSTVVLFALVGLLLFLAGYAVEQGLLNSLGSMVALLMIAALVSLHGFRPLSQTDIAGPVGCLLLAAVLSTVIRRFLWPVLPQNTFRATLTRQLALLEKRASSPDTAAPMANRAEVALYSADCVTLVGVLENLGVLPSPQAAHCRSYLRSLARLGGHLLASTGSASLPPAAAELYTRERAQLLAAVAGQLRLQRLALDHAAARPELPPLPPTREWTTRCRNLTREHATEVIAIYLALGLLYRIEQIAISASEAGRSACVKEM